ncbi:Acid phosphatase [Hypsizygus marmoreus]|uniref:Acid phosphatase n=1 Tax=Hypsizygus marmoreus TaxID=39966 RepID=A0A369IZD5_HYPMA|nr:Acid phosphatase [Hypsizygus marmoreus]
MFSTKTMRYLSLLAALLPLCAIAKPHTVVVGNDDGWAVAQIRSQFTTLRAAGYIPLLSAPALNKSGAGNSTTTPKPLDVPCEFSTCPAGSPAVGSSPYPYIYDPYITYVNAYPVDAITYGINTTGRFLFGAVPDLAIVGPNVGNNLGPIIKTSATVRAAAAASLLGVPSVAFSAQTGAQISYITLFNEPTSKNSIAAAIYSRLTVNFLDNLKNSGSGPILPPGVSINVNYPAIDTCTSVESFSWVLTRVAPSTSTTVDVETCEGTQLRDESTVIKSGCYATVSVFNATTIEDVDAGTQAFVLNRLEALLSCIP